MEKFVVELTLEEESLRQIIEPLLNSEGFDLVRIKLARSGAKSKLSLFIDTIGRGIVLENLEDISRLLSDVLDASFNDETILRDSYDLEVSSPGLDRPLSKVSHFLDVAGERIRIKLKEADKAGTRKISGVLLEAHDDFLVMTDMSNKDEPRRINYSDLSEANVMFDFSKVRLSKKSGEKNGF